MMRNSALLKWAHNANNNKQTTKEGNRTWIHPPDALQRGHIAYLVKFLGNTEVDQPKGITVVKESIRKLQFNQQLRKAEGNKTPKVELTISIDGVAIQEPKTKRIMHQYPLHRISYCADDKGEKKFFSFIAKEADSENHNCFVFVSDKLSEEITLTIGQAFDLAYRRFLETSGKDLELQRRFVLLTQKASRLENEVAVLRQRLSDVSKIKGQSDVEEYMAKNGIADLLIVDQPTISSSTETSPSFNQSDSSSSDQLSSPQNLQNRENGNLLNFNSSSNSSNGMNSPPLTQSPTSVQPPPVPPRAFEASNSKPFGEFTSDLPTVGRKLEGLLFEELEDDFNPRAYEQSTNGSQFHPPLLAPPPKASREASRRLSSQNNGSLDTFKEDLFGSTPFNPEVGINNTQSTNIQSSSVTTDPFGMGDFSVGDNTNPSQQELESAIGFIDKRLLEMKDGFSRGLSFGNDDFSLESLDPLRH